MNVTCIVVAAQHPIAIDIQIRNLQWAINPTKIVIFTFKAYGLTSKYDNVEFVEVNRNPGQFFYFYRKVIPDYIKSDRKADVFVFNELDIYFDRKVHDCVEQAYKTKMVFVGNMYKWYALYKNKEFIYPRLWEGGLICHAKYICDALNYGAVFSLDYEHRTCIAKLKSGDYTFMFDGEHIGYGGKHPVYGLVTGDQFSELQMYCHLLGYKTKVPNYIVHFSGPETIHRNFPNMYNNLDVYYNELIDLMKYRGTATVFHKYLCGHLKQETVWKTLHYIEKDWAKEIIRLTVKAEEWMTEDEFERLLFVYRHIYGTHALL